MEFEDLKDEDGKAKGTRVVVKISYRFKNIHTDGSKR